MNALACDFQDVFQLYLRLGQDLTRILNEDNSADPQALVQSILGNRDCLVRIEQMNSRVLELSDNWEKCRDNLDPSSINEIRDLAQAAKAQAIRLKELCGIHTQKLQITRDELCSRMAELNKADQHLKSLKPIKTNYPKFIDSQY
jgi:hypothetical protein